MTGAMVVVIRSLPEELHLQGSPQKLLQQDTTRNGPGSAANSRTMLDATANLIVDCLRQIGLTVRLAPLGTDTFLPGVTLEPGGLIVDPERLLYPGDLLHEAGTLPPCSPRSAPPPDRTQARTWVTRSPPRPGLMPAAVHLGLAPRSSSTPPATRALRRTLFRSYRDGNAGVPLLQWMGLTLDPKTRRRGIPSSLPAHASLATREQD